MKQLLTLWLAYGFLLCAGRSHAQLPARQWQQTYSYTLGSSIRYSPYGDLIRLSPNRLVIAGGFGLGNGNIRDYAAGFWWFNNRGDTVRTRLNLRTQTNINQGIYAAGYGYAALAALARGDLLVSGTRSNSTVQGVFVPGSNFLARYDSMGTVRWINYFLVNGDQSNHHLLVGLPDGGGIFACQAAYPGVPNVRTISVLRFDSVGAVVWQRNVGRANASSLPYALTALPDGSYAMAGYQNRPAAPGPGFAYADAWMFRITSAGDTSQSRYYGVPASLNYFTDVKASERGGLLLCGNIRNGAAVQEQGWLLQLDSLGRVQWERKTDPNPSINRPNHEFYQCHALQGGGALVRGAEFLPNTFLISTNYQALYRPSIATAQLVWTLPLVDGREPNLSSDWTSRGELTLSGVVDNPVQPSVYSPISLLRLQTVERPYVPNYCQTPPVARLAYSFNAAGNVATFLELSDAGPRYAQIVRWRWHLGDGTFYEGRVPPPHRYTVRPGPATPVTLTVTNNLGCSNTEVRYPFALGNAAGYEAAARATLWPNPAADEATLQLSEVQTGPVQVALLDVLGRPVRSYVARPTNGLLTQILNLSGLAAGVYAVRVTLADGSSFGKRLVVKP